MCVLLPITSHHQAMKNSHQMSHHRAMESLPTAMKSLSMARHQNQLVGARELPEAMTRNVHSQAASSKAMHMQLG